MGNDHPDWGGNYNDAQFYPLFDQAELAARLGSPITYDRRGALLWHYDFSYGLGSVFFSTSFGASYALQVNKWERPPFSCKLLTGDNAGSQISMYRRAAIPQSLRVGFQASIRVGTGVDAIVVKLSHFTGVSRYYGQLTLDMANLDLRLYDGVTGSVTLDDDLPDLASASYFAHVKVVCDFNDHTYIRGLLDQSEYDLTAYTMGSQPDDTAPHLEGRVVLANDGAVEAYCYVDALIITAAEPANA